MPTLRSYPKVWALGHPNKKGLTEGPVVVQEKVDGSQFSFGVIEGQLHCRSRRADIYPETADSLFRPAVETAQRLFSEEKLVEGWVYRGEALCRPKHNVIEYGRAPFGGVILFDIDTALETRLPPAKVAKIAETMGLEFVPTFYEGEVSGADQVKGFLDRESCLGKAKIEGVVIKNYNKFNNEDGKMLMGKYVSEAFKEQHRSDWKKVHKPGGRDIVDAIVGRYATEGRWRKAVQHLREAGTLESSPRDIGPLLKELNSDAHEELQDVIKDILFKSFWKNISRGLTRGFPEWYKEQLLAAQFEADATPETSASEE